MITEHSARCSVDFDMDDRTLARFEAKYHVEPNTGCWLWTACVNEKGYGYFSLTPAGRSPSNRGAHRVSYEHHRGPIPLGFVIDHLCRQRCCVNPDHLEAVTNRENILRGVGVTAANAERDTCMNGHPYDEANTRMSNTTPPRRKCRACNMAWKRGWRSQQGTRGTP